MAAEKNQRYFLVLMRKRICGIDHMKLIKPQEEKAVDWENLPPIPFDFSVDLPLAWMHAVELDSKIHLVGGRKYLREFPDGVSGGFRLSKKIYELNLDKNELEESKSIGDALWFFDTLKDALQKIGSDYYFILMGGSVPMWSAGNFSVLRSRTKVWEYLPVAPSETPPGDVVDSSWFNFYGKLYLRLCLEDERVCIHSYDTHNPLEDWRTCEGDDSFTRSFYVTVSADGQRQFFPPRVHIPDSVDPGKYLALSCKRIGGKALICAFQVDELGVYIFQRLEGCLDRMPSFIHEKTPMLVDLDGKGMFLVMLPGFANQEKLDPVLCMLVLQVIPKKVVNCPSRVLRRSPRFPTECEFLEWMVLSVHMYSMNEGVNHWSGVFNFPRIPCDEAIVYEVPRRGKRKYSQI